MAKTDGIGTFIAVIIAIGIICLFVSPFLLFKVVGAGQVGIDDTFGKVPDSIRNSGFHLKSPFTAIRTMSIKSIQIMENASVPSKEGLIVNLDVSIIYRINPEKAPELYRTVGMNYEDVIITPQLRSEIREATSQNEAKALYTEGRTIVAEEIFNKLSPELKDRGIILEQVLLRDLKLPDAISTAIQQKLTAEQQIEQKKFEVEKEKQEALRKIVEAGGIAESQKIINNGLTTQYLTWYWISHIKDAQSIFYIPIGQDGLPIFKEVGSTQ